MENHTMAATESIRKGLMVYQVLIAIGGVLTFLSGMLTLVSPISPELIRSIGASGLSWIKLISALVGLGGAAFAFGFFWLLRGTGRWLEGVSRWTWGDSVNTVHLDDIHSSMQRWLRAGQWVPLVLAVITFVGATAAVVIPATLAARAGNRVLVSSSDLNGGAVLLLVANFVLFLVLPAVLNFFALGSVRRWLERVNRPLTRKPPRSYVQSLTQVSAQVNVWFIIAQAVAGVVLVVYVLGLVTRLGSLLVVLLFVPWVGIPVLGLIALVIGYYLLPILLLEWSKVFMRGVTAHLEPENRNARAFV